MVRSVVEEPAYRDRVGVFKDRLQAGVLLAEKLRPQATGGNVQLLAIPAGGVPVGYAMADELKISMDVLVVRKIQVPWNPEAGFGAIAWDGRVFLNEPLVTQLGLDAKTVERCISRTRQVVYERLQRFRGDRPFPDLGGRVVIIVDDGLASGFSMLAAVESVKAQKPTRIVVAVPTGSANAVKLLASKVDEIVCLNIRSGPIFAVADAYEKWYDVTDQGVLQYLSGTTRAHP